MVCAPRSPSFAPNASYSISFASAPAPPNPASPILIKISGLAEVGELRVCPPVGVNVTVQVPTPKP